MRTVTHCMLETGVQAGSPVMRHGRWPFRMPPAPAEHGHHRRLASHPGGMDQVVWASALLLRGNWTMSRHTRQGRRATEAYAMTLTDKAVAKAAIVEQRPPWQKDRARLAAMAMGKATTRVF